MPQAVRSVDIYLPLDFNDGRPIPESKFVGVQRELLKRFGGVTSTQRQFPLQGVWQASSGVFQDRVVVFTVMDFRGQTHLELLHYLEGLKARLKKFNQLEILITVQELLAI